jgi:signal transduction histidine kinase
MLITWLERHPRLVDWALFLFALASAVGVGVGHSRRPVVLLVAIAGTVPLLWRRRAPLVVLAAATAATAVAVAVWGLYDPVPAGIALYTVAEGCPRQTSLAAGGAAMIALAVVSLPTARWSLFGRLLPFVVAWLVGDSVRARRSYVGALEERADRLEREREAEAARAVAEEQARIGRELHDVIAHSVSVMVVQAAAADDVFDSRPDRAREALRNIERTGRGALEELRRVLGGVRGEPASFAPQPGLGELDRLLDQVRAAGLRVVLSVEGAPRPVPQAVDLSAYRIVQEALTNTLKHAGAHQADVLIRYGESELGVEVRDDGAGGVVNGSGHGLIGMRERAALLGGSLTAGPGPVGGFSIAARLPLGAGA